MSSAALAFGGGVNTGTALAAGPVDCAAFQAIAERALDDLDAPGVAFAVLQDESECVAVAGLADRAGVPVSAQTRFYAASSGKPMVATAVLSAAQDGLLNLDALIEPHLRRLGSADNLGPHASSVTVRQLLGHRSGLPEYLTDDFAEARPPAGGWTPAAALAFADARDARRPGRRFDYNNTNYVLLGAILAQIDGSLGASLNARIFRPAGMTASSVGRGRGPLARGYDGRRDVSAAAYASVLGDGAVTTTAADLARFARALLASDRILGSAWRAAMVEGALRGERYGLGIEGGRDALGIYYGHSGGYDGFGADVRYYPEVGLALAVTANAALDDAAPLDDAARWLAGR